MRPASCAAAALAALLVLLAPTFPAARVPPPLLPDLRALARQHQAPASAPADRVPPEFNINSGGPAVGRFVADNPAWLVGPTSAFVAEDVVIGGAEEKNLPMYKSHRFGKNASTWGYDIPVMEPGTYGCTVHFAETSSDAFAVAARVFDLYLATAHGDPVKFSDVDIFAELNGAQFTVLTKTAVDLVIPGILSIRAVPSAGDAIISGVTCERTGDLPDGVDPDWETDPSIPTEAVTNITGSPAPTAGVAIKGTEINVNVGGPEVGRFLAEDYAWIRGVTSFWGGPGGVDIGGAEEKNRPALISHRYGLDGGRWGLVIPITMPGIYHCSLHFAETDSASFKVGARVFNLLIQDRLLSDVDVYRDAGNAPFTSVVKTFLDLKVGNELLIALVPVTGNAFLSAITCERAADLSPEDLASLTSASPEPPLDESPTPEESVAETLEPAAASESPVPTSTPGVIITVPIPSATPEVPETTVTPVVSPTVESSPSDPDETPFPAASPSDGFDPVVDASPSAEFGEESPEPSSDGLDNLVDPAIVASDDEVSMIYELTGTVVGGGLITEEMKDALLAVSKRSSDVESSWAMIAVASDDDGDSSSSSSSSSDPVNLQSGSKYNIDLQAVYTKDDEEKGLNDYKSFINDGEVNTELEQSGSGDLTVEFRSEPTLSALGQNPASVASTSSTSTLVGALVGGILALLTVAALTVFFVSRRNRRNNNDAAAFDAPPPAMTESEMSSVLERSNTAASMEYLDDDSTYTAATSRAGDHVDQVNFDKDIFGRGTAAGAHGTSA